MGRITSQSKVICASNTSSLYALPLCDSTKPQVNLQSSKRILQMLHTEMRWEYAD